MQIGASRRISSLAIPTTRCFSPRFPSASTALLLLFHRKICQWYIIFPVSQRIYRNTILRYAVRNSSEREWNDERLKGEERRWRLKEQRLNKTSKASRLFATSAIYTDNSNQDSNNGNDKLEIFNFPRFTKGFSVLFSDTSISIFFVCHGQKNCDTLSFEDAQKLRKQFSCIRKRRIATLYCPRQRMASNWSGNLWVRMRFTQITSPTLQRVTIILAT